MVKLKTAITVIILLVAIPTVVVAGVLLFREKYYVWLSLCVAMLSCLPLFYCFERKESTSKELTVLAVLIALSAVGRFVFYFLPGFKPITAITVIVAVHLGKEAGFVVGALSAVLSNFYFGQGPWTPFQMFAWGLIGFLAGILAKPLKKSRILLWVYGALSGIIYSCTLDIWTTLSTEGAFSLARYAATALTSLPTTISYVVSNVIFLLLLGKFIGEKLDRIRKKYGLFLKKYDAELALFQ